MPLESPAKREDQEFASCVRGIQLTVSYSKLLADTRYRKQKENQI